MKLLEEMKGIKGEHCNKSTTWIINENEDDYIILSLITDSNMGKYRIRQESSSAAMRLLATDDPQEAIDFYKSTIEELSSKIGSPC